MKHYNFDLFPGNKSKIKKYELRIAAAQISVNVYAWVWGGGQKPERIEIERERERERNLRYSFFTCVATSSRFYFFGYFFRKNIHHIYFSKQKKRKQVTAQI